MKPKILIIIDQLEVGGAQTFALDLYEKLATDFDIYFLALRDKTDSLILNKAKEFAKNVVILDLNFKKPFFIIEKIKQEIEKVKPNIVHTHLVYADIYGRWAAKKNGVKNIFSTVHNLEPWRGNLLNLTGLRVALLDRYLARSTKKIIALSKKMKGVLVKKEGIPKDKIAIIYNGVNTWRFRPQPKNWAKIKELNIDPQKTILGFIGRLEPQKGVSFLLSAFAKLKNKNLVLLIIGGGSLKKELEQKAKRIKSQNKIIFLGQREDMVDLLNIIDILVMPSLFEGMPIVLLEAMACHKIIIATNVPGIKGTVNSTEAKLIKPRDMSLLKKAMEEVLRSPEKYQKMAQRARLKVKQSLSLEICAQKYKNLYLDCTKL